MPCRRECERLGRALVMHSTFEYLAWVSERVFFLVGSLPEEPLARSTFCCVHKGIFRICRAFAHGRHICDTFRHALLVERVSEGFVQICTGRALSDCIFPFA